jgi:6-phosphogluconolactonase
MDLRTVDRDRLPAVLAQDFLQEATRALDARGFFAVALPGGSVAESCFPQLAALPFDWSRLRCFWVDERAVPPTDADSNYALARAHLLDPAGVPASSVHRMRGEGPDLEAAAAAYSRELEDVLGRPARLDYVLLGVGPDGHVASLFPGHPALERQDGLVAAVADAPKPPPRRLTLTLPVLAGAVRVGVVAFGEEKAAAIRDAVEGDGAQPLAQVLRRTSRPLILIDPAAARLLRPSA